MTFWRWFLVWVLLLVASAVYLFFRGRHLWGQFTSLTRETDRAMGTLDALETQTDRIRMASGPTSLAVFERPGAIRDAYEELRSIQREERDARRALRAPGWARPRR